MPPGRNDNVADETDLFNIRETFALQDEVAEQAWSHPDDSAYDDYDRFHVV